MAKASALKAKCGCTLCQDSGLRVVDDRYAGMIPCGCSARCSDLTFALFLNCTAGIVVGTFAFLLMIS